MQAQTRAQLSKLCTRGFRSVVERRICRSTGAERKETARPSRGLQGKGAGHNANAVLRTETHTGRRRKEVPEGR